MSDHPKVAIFWDYENCSPPSNSCGLGYDIVNNVARIARLFGSVTTFRAYLDISAQSPKSVTLRSELQSSGVSMIDCPHNGKKDVVDKMILVDMLAFAVDHPAPATVVLITGDRDYAYAVSILKLRKYQVILVVPSSPHAPPCLESQASLVVDWGAAVLRTRTEALNSTQAIRQPYLDVDASLVTKLVRELQELSVDDPDTTLHPSSTTSQSASRLQRMSTRDLLELSRHSKNTESFDSTQEFSHTPASPRKSISTGSDSAPGGLPIPKTPSRSRHASVSTGSTRARSATIVAQSPPAMEQDVPARNPPPPTDAAGPAKRSPSVLPSLDVLELPLHDNRPPSSIIIRSALEPDQSAGDLPVPGIPSIPSTRKLNFLASPFVMNEASTKLESTPNPCGKQSYTTVKPTSPIVAPTKTLTDPGVPKEIEHLTGPRIEDNDGNSERSIPHRVYPKEGTRDASDTPKSNYHPYVASRTTYSPSSRSVGLHLTDTPSSKPAATFLGAGDGVDSVQLAAFPRASNTQDYSAPGSEPVLSPTAFPSTSATTADSHEYDESEGGQMWTMFKPLVRLLLAARERGTTRPSRSIIAVELVQLDKQVYQRAGTSRFRDYTALAEQAGIIELGGSMGDAWIALHPKWFRDDITTTHFLSNRVSSPTSDPPRAIQNSLLTGSKTPLIVERAEILQTPTFTSSERRSLEYSNMLPTLATDSASRASVPVQFQPLIDILTWLRAEGSHQVIRSVAGQLLGQGVYAQAGVSGFKEYIQQASEARVVQLGGVGVHAWIRLHPELRV
ncbi:hypothetical protein J3R83DRAFT_1952 [Lanmaoa asiatica]|nr:hypothetical protein J3R83DRAFT_1952 [Lanmaoa asiatica]